VADALAELPSLAAALADAALTQRAATERLQEARRIAADRQATGSAQVGAASGRRAVGVAGRAVRWSARLDARFRTRCGGPPTEPAAKPPSRTHRRTRGRRSAVRAHRAKL